MGGSGAGGGGAAGAAGIHDGATDGVLQLAAISRQTMAAKAARVRRFMKKSPRGDDLAVSACPQQGRSTPPEVPKNRDPVKYRHSRARTRVPGYSAVEGPAGRP